MPNKKNITKRIGEDFVKELDKVIKIRKDIGKDKKKRGYRELTNLITKHDSWHQIKKDLININLGEERK